MRAKDFDYFLPQDLIAQHPMEPRDHSRLMLLDKTSGSVQHDIFSNLCEYLQKDDLLIFNDTRVIPARLHGVKESGAKAEVLLLTRINTTDWEVLVRPGKKLQVGTTIIFSEDLTCNVISNTDFGGRTIRFSYKGVFEEILDRLGETPLPPYINEPLKDSERYQTVYARERGSAAAPTAGLHFTKELLDKIQRTGAEMVFVTLHVGLGTFRPVSVADVENHVMHKEFYSVTLQAADKINEAKKAGRRIVAVGTTAVRTLEASGKDGLVKAGSNWTEIFIYPGYEFRIVDALITNFHLPQSTLLMLVSALSSREAILQAYGTAVQEKYRFFSFGDAMFIR